MPILVQTRVSIAPLVFNFTGFCSRKYFNLDDWTNQRSYIDGILIRYAEVLLNYAEAKFELKVASAMPIWT
nr:RagB/SusD family nutrient uptake outer membrane protein [Haliscomenobacter sp.]